MRKGRLARLAELSLFEAVRWPFWRLFFLLIFFRRSKKGKAFGSRVFLGFGFWLFWYTNRWPWFTWWFNHLPGPSIYPKRTPMFGVPCVTLGLKNSDTGCSCSVASVRPGAEPQVPDSGPDSQSTENVALQTDSFHVN